MQPDSKCDHFRQLNLLLADRTFNTVAWHVKRAGNWAGGTISTRDECLAPPPGALRVPGYEIALDIARRG